MVRSRSHGANHIQFSFLGGSEAGEHGDVVLEVAREAHHVVRGNPVVEVVVVFAGDYGFGFARVVACDGPLQRHRLPRVLLRESHLRVAVRLTGPSLGHAVPQHGAVHGEVAIVRSPTAAAAFFLVAAVCVLVAFMVVIILVRLALSMLVSAGASVTTLLGRNSVCCAAQASAVCGRRELGRRRAGQALLHARAPPHKRRRYVAHFHHPKLHGVVLPEDEQAVVTVPARNIGGGEAVF
mmetsp:Transcript_40215/g.76880  ORF Transcript_40215/g.76880 Transcript_40215/m.76880 type:complete len:238 (+) Transcript_40215:507-1220(+)